MKILRIKLLVYFFYIVSMSGCVANKIDRGEKKSLIYSQENLVDTNSDNRQKFHAVIHYPFEHALRYPGLIIGIEKGQSFLINDDKLKNSLFKPNSLSKSDEWLINKILTDENAQFISHVVKISQDIDVTRPTVPELKRNAVSIYGDRNPCYLYNVYQDGSDDGIYRKRLDNVEYCNGKYQSNTYPYSGGWDAIFRIKNEIKNDLSSALKRGSGGYSHVIVIVMGWNTEQIESIQNFNSIVDRLAKTKKSPNEFRPYVIGVTWPSLWSNPLFDSVVKALSLINKSDDADELGAGWLGAIFDYGILPIISDDMETKIPLLVIGHSFGARASSSAVCRGTLLRPGPRWAIKKSSADAKVDWLVGLEGAYSMNRYTIGAGHMKLDYPNQCSRASRLIFTSSSNDSAAELASKLLFESEFVASSKTFKKAVKSEIDGMRFANYTASSNGDLKAECQESFDPTSRFLYVDASEVIFFKAYGTKMGAHSDIYRTETAKMIWNAITASPKEDDVKCRSGQSVH